MENWGANGGLPYVCSPYGLPYLGYLPGQRGVISLLFAWEIMLIPEKPSLSSLIRRAPFVPSRRTVASLTARQARVFPPHHIRHIVAGLPQCRMRARVGDLSSWETAETSADGTISNVILADSWTLEIAQDAHPRAFFRLFLDQILPGTPSP